MKPLIFSLCITFLSITFANKLQPKIIGGQTTRYGEYPFAAAIYITKPDGSYFCGGTLITNQWVLTSGYCAYNATLFRIQLGSNSLTREDSYRVTVATSEWEAHPEFDPLTLRNDIALIRLRLPVEYSDYLRQIRFMPEYRFADGMSAMAIGWGQTSDEQAGLEDEILYANLTALSTDECRIYYGNQVTEDMVCVIGNYNEGACIGDIGSPLIQYIGQSYYMNVGVASFISGNGCESLEPSGYTRTFSYMDWIRTVTEAEFNK